MIIVNNIKKYRTERGLTQKQLAEQVGCGQSRIADYEAERYRTSRSDSRSELQQLSNAQSRTCSQAPMK